MKTANTLKFFLKFGWEEIVRALKEDFHLFLVRFEVEEKRHTGA